MSRDADVIGILLLAVSVLLREGCSNLFSKIHESPRRNARAFTSSVRLYMLFVKLLAAPLRELSGLSGQHPYEMQHRGIRTFAPQLRHFPLGVQESH